jgi:hypothetical protein
LWTSLICPALGLAAARLSDAWPLAPRSKSYISGLRLGLELSM